MKRFLGIACLLGALWTAPVSGSVLPLGMTPPHLTYSNLSPDEQQFANHLCYPHRIMFCQEFTMQQRREAMQLMYKRNIPPNEAVHEVIMRNHMMGPYSSGSPMATHPCSKLGNKEYYFAMALCPAHRQIFCTQFRSSQRKQAIKLARKHPMLSPDQAVHIIMEEQGMRSYMRCNHRMSMPSSRGMNLSSDGNPYGNCRNW